MDREQTESLARQIAQALVDHAVIPECDKAKVTVIATMELNKELVEPLERVCQKLTLSKNGIGSIRIS